MVSQDKGNCFLGTHEKRRKPPVSKRRISAADARAGKLKDQLTDLQGKFADVAKAQKPKATANRGNSGGNSGQQLTGRNNRLQ